MHQPAIMLGITTALGLSRSLARGAVGRSLQTLAGSAFLVFAVHEPLLTVVHRIAIKITGTPGPALDLALYVALPVAVIVGACVLDRILRRILPRFTATITGGR